MRCRFIDGKGKWCSKQAIDGSQQCKTHTAQTARREEKMRAMIEEEVVQKPKEYAPRWNAAETDDPARRVRFKNSKHYSGNIDTSNMTALGKNN